MVEHSAVNRVVVGSSPTRGAYGPMVKRLRHRPFTAVTRVRISLGSLKGSSVFIELYFSKERLSVQNPIIAIWTFSSVG